MLIYFENIIQSIDKNPEIKISDIEIISEKEKMQILDQFNNKTVDYPQYKTIHQLFEEQVKKTPENIALVFEYKSLTYIELNEKANQLAHYLRSKGIKNDCPVGLMCERSFEMVIGMLGILKAGGAYVPIDPEYPEDRKKHMLESSCVNIVLTYFYKKESPKLIEDNVEIVDLKNIFLFETMSKENLDSLSSCENLAYIIYTSGSTGTPKGVMLEHRNLVNLLLYQNDYTNLTFNRVLQFTTMSFDVSFQEIFSTLSSGGTLYLIRKEIRNNVEKLFKLIDANKIETLFFPASYLKFILNEEEYVNQLPATIKHIITAGEQLIVTKKFRDYLKKKKVFLHNHYGPSETHVVTALTLNPEGEIPFLPSIGKPLVNTSIYIVDENMHIVPPGISGEIFISGVQVGRGYYNQEKITAEKFVTNPFGEGNLYKTGDLARWLPDGNIEFLGRIDHQVKVRGFRVEPGEIESAILNIGSIKEAVVVDKIDTANQKFLCAYYVSEKALETAEIEEALSKKLPGYMIPSYFVSLEKIPLTPNGKTDKKALPEPEVELKEYIPPSNETEKKLQEIWSEVLSMSKEKIGLDSDFFRIGGHSLKATILSSLINKKMKIDFPVSYLFKYTTIRKQAQIIKDLSRIIHDEIDIVENAEFYKASSVQKRLYFLQNMDKTTCAYNMPGIVEIKGEFNIEKVEQIFLEIINRHESLRTSFFMKDQEIFFKIIFENGIRFSLFKQNEESKSIQDIMESFIKPFDLSKAPLIRVEVVKLNKKNYYLLFDMHHIISDGISLDILINEFSKLYNDLDLQDLRIQYKDYACWLEKRKASFKSKEDETYWIKQFEGKIPVLNFSTDYNRPSIQNFEGRSVNFTLSRKQSEKIKKLAEKYNATNFMTLFSIFNLFLSKLSNDEDIVVGTPVSGRTHADVQNMIGMFVNTLAIRSFPNGSKTFENFIKEIKDNLLEAFDHQMYQYEDLVENLNVKRDSSRNPLFDVFFSYEDFNFREITLPDIEISLKDYDFKISKFDLSLRVSECKDNFNCCFEYATKLFNEKTILRFVNYFKNVIDGVVGNPEIKISDIEIITELEKHQILYEFNNTQTDYPKNKTIHQMFEEQVERTPENVALLFEGKTLTYKELNKKSNQLARKIRAKGVIPDTIVGIIAERSFEMIIGIFGILKSGGAYLPIDPDYPEERIRFMLDDSGAALVLTTKNLEGKAKKCSNGEIINLCDKSLYEGELSNLDHLNSSRDLAYVIYTSGTTGKPKGVLIEHYSVLNRLKWMQKNYSIEHGDILIQKTPATFDVSVWELFWWSFEGASLYLMSPGEHKEPEKIVKAIANYGITTIHFVPSMLNMFLDYVEEFNLADKLSSLKQIFASGEALYTDHLNKFNALLRNSSKTKLINLYGPTEATVDVSYFNCFLGNNYSHVPIGKPIDNTQLYIVNSKNNLNPIGISGELLIGGVQLARGYLNRDDLTRKKFIPNPFGKGRLYKTGDLARWLPDGNIEFLGRIDHQVKIRGLRIELVRLKADFLKLKI